MSHPWSAAALRYAANGWPVFMLGRNKRPLANCADCPNTKRAPSHDPQACPCLTCHGFYAATRDPATISRILAAEPCGMLAIRTGAPSRLVVVDVDPAKGGRDSLAALIEQGVTPPTRYVVTGSGGLHLYYRHPGPHMRIPCSESKLGPGIDVRADGGYVAAPPSIHPRTRRPYAWADDARPIGEIPLALVSACIQVTTAPPAAPVRAEPTTTGGRGIPFPDRLLAALIDAIDRAPEGRRRVTLYGSARGVARMVAADVITRADAVAALTYAGRRAQQTESDITKAISGAFRDEGVTL